MEQAEYEQRVRELMQQGCTRSDAQGIVDAELMQSDTIVVWER